MAVQRETAWVVEAAVDTRKVVVVAAGIAVEEPVDIPGVQMHRVGIHMVAGVVAREPSVLLAQYKHYVTYRSVDRLNVRVPLRLWLCLRRLR